MYAVEDEVGISVGFDDGDTLSFHFLLYIFAEVNVETNTDEQEMNYIYIYNKYSVVMCTVQ